MNFAPLLFRYMLTFWRMAIWHCTVTRFSTVHFINVTQIVELLRFVVSFSLFKQSCSLIISIRIFGTSIRLVRSIATVVQGIYPFVISEIKRTGWKKKLFLIKIIKIKHWLLFKWITRITSSFSQCTVRWNKHWIRNGRFDSIIVRYFKCLSEKVNA